MDRTFFRHHCGGARGEVVGGGGGGGEKVGDGGAGVVAGSSPLPMRDQTRYNAVA